MGILRWTAVALAALAALAALVWGVGAALPVEHRASVTRRVAAPPEAVWRAVTEVEAFPAWRSQVTGVVRAPDRDGLPAWRETASWGPLDLAVERWDPPRGMVVRVTDPGGAFGGTWTYALAPEEGGTRVTLTEDGEVHSPLFRFVSRFVTGHEGTMRAYLDDLDAHLAAAPAGGAGR